MSTTHEEDAMLTRILGEHVRCYGYGYQDGRAWGLTQATRTDLHTARQLKAYSGQQMLTDGTPTFGEGVRFQYPAGVPDKDIPGLPADLEVYAYDDPPGARFSRAYDHLKPHLGPGEEGDFYAYAEGWRDALSDLYGALLDAEKYGRAPTGPQAEGGRADAR